MSGIIGHTMYAVLASKAATDRKLPIAPVLARHYASYLCGAYLGSDIQTLPEAICVDTGQEVGYGTLPLDKSPLTGGKVRPWTLKFQDRDYSPREIHARFYGRAHLVFGWSAADRQHTVPWDHLADYVAMTVQDAIDLFDPGERKLAYLFGWLAHIVGDSLIKSIHPGVTLNLLDGVYTAKNRPIQDLVTYHEIGRKEFGIDWPALLGDLAETPIEPVQLHAMRVTRPRGTLAQHFPNAWTPGDEPLMRQVLLENRRYLKVYLKRLLPEYQLTESKAGPICNAELSRITGGLSYNEMVAAADQANFRHALWQIGAATVELFEQVVNRVPALANLPSIESPTWDAITRGWKR